MASTRTTPPPPPPGPAIAPSFVRKLYRLLDHEDPRIVSWDVTGESFSIKREDAFVTDILPRYFRGKLNAFRQQLVDHGFIRVVSSYRTLPTGALTDLESYQHDFFLRGHPMKLTQIVNVPQPRPRRRRATEPPQATPTHALMGRETQTTRAPAVARGKRRNRFSPRDIDTYSTPPAHDVSTLNTIARLVTVSIAMPDARPEDLCQRPTPLYALPPAPMISPNYETRTFPSDVMATMLDCFGGGPTEQTTATLEGAPAQKRGQLDES